MLPAYLISCCLAIAPLLLFHFSISSAAYIYPIVHPPGLGVVIISRFPNYIGRPCPSLLLFIAGWFTGLHLPTLA